MANAVKHIVVNIVIAAVVVLVLGMALGNVEMSFVVHDWIMLGIQFVSATAGMTVLDARRGRFDE